MPTRQSFVLDMVTNREDLGNAIALNSSLFNSARLIGPSIAGVLVATVGEGLCFLINGISFIAVIACLLAMRMAPTPPRGKQEDFFRGMKDGAAYAFGFPPVKYIIMLLAFASLVAMPYPVLMPVFAKEILQGGANTLGFLMAGAGVGALAGAIYLASRKNVFGLDKIIVVAALQLRYRPDKFFPVPGDGPFHAFHGDNRLRHGGAAGGQQYHPSDDRR